MQNASHRVDSLEDQRELEEAFGQRYARIQTGLKGITPLSRKQRRAAIRKARQRRS